MIRYFIYVTKTNILVELNSIKKMIIYDFQFNPIEPI